MVGFWSPNMLVRFKIWNVSQNLRLFSAFEYGSSGPKSTWAMLEEIEELTRVRPSFNQLENFPKTLFVSW